MKQMGIYAIRCKTTQKLYVGSSHDITTRWTAHKYKLRKNCHHSKKLQEAWNLYGESNFELEIIEEVLDKSLLIPTEQKHIDAFDSCSKGYNSASIACRVERPPLRGEVKIPATFRLTPTSARILKTVADMRGISQAEVLEEAIRKLMPIEPS